MEHLSTSLIYKSLGFHGQPLQKIWEGERGENDLQKLGVVDPDFSTYQARQKNLTFQDRAKRLKLHQFISKKAKFLFDVRLVEEVPRKINHEKIAGGYAVVPSYEIFLNADKSKRQRHFFNIIQPGDIVYGTVFNKSTSGMIIKVACTSGIIQRYVADLNVKAYLPISNSIPAVDKKNNCRNYNISDTVCCEVLEVIPDTDKMIVTMKSIHNSSVQFGLVENDSFPDIFKSATELKGESYDTILEKAPGFSNPHCIEVLSEELGLDVFENYTNMSSLRGRFPQQDYSNELRQVQASKWAFRSVAEGIEHFKEGRHSEAFQCLNKALSIDPRNVEGLVARGALYANSGSFKKAVDDFETALKLNPSHTNARKYMGETLVALGRSYEEENKIDEARKAYQDCLIIIPHHEEAQNSLDFLKNKTSVGKQLIEPGELMLPALNINKSNIDPSKNEREASTSKKDAEMRNKDKKSKKKKSKGNKRRSDTSTSSSESSESSDTTSDSSSSSESSSSSDSDSNSKKKRRSKKSRPKSLSPLSKRMALMGDAVVGDNAFQFNQPFGESSNQESGLDEYEIKVRKFLEITRDEDDYEEKVRRFVEEASKYRKERKIIEEKAKKKKKKEARKLKKESKKRRKEKDREERKKAKLSKKDKLELDAIENKKLRDALKLFENFPLEQLETKLSNLFDKNNTPQLFDGEVQSQPDLLYQSLLENETSSGKWKMAFAKDERKKDSQSTSATKPIPKQYAFANESESDDERNTTLGAPIQHPPPPPPIANDKIKKRVQSPHPKSKYQEHHTQPPALAKAVVKSGPVVLDKFGNFRLATMETTKPPEPPGSPRRNSRSRSRSRAARKYSSSRSRSRSQRKRSRSGSYVRKYSRSRSRSYRTRTRSRSRSRSYSRSRSRSRSVRRYDRRGFRGRGGFNDRGTYYKPRFNNHPRGRGRGNYRDYRDYRGGRDRGRPFRPRAARGGNRYYRNYREGSRDRRYSRDRSEERDRRSYSDDRPRSPHGETENNKISPTKPENDSKTESMVQPALLDIEGRWADDKQEKSDKHHEAPE